MHACVYSQMHHVLDASSTDARVCAHVDCASTHGCQSCPFIISASTPDVLCLLHRFRAESAMPPSFSRLICYAPPSPYTPAFVCFRITNDIWSNVMYRWLNSKVRWMEGGREGRREGGREGGRDVRTCTVYVLTHVCMYAPVTCMYACTLHRQGVKARAETASRA